MKEGEGLGAKVIAAHKPATSHTTKKMARHPQEDGATAQRGFKRRTARGEKGEQVRRRKETQQPLDNISSSEEEIGEAEIVEDRAPRAPRRSGSSSSNSGSSSRRSDQNKEKGGKKKRRRTAEQQDRQVLEQLRNSNDEEEEDIQGDNNSEEEEDIYGPETSVEKRTPTRQTTRPSLTKQGEGGVLGFYSAQKRSGGTVDGTNSDSTIKEFVRSTVFKNIKFVVTDQEIEFGNNICAAVVRQMKIVEDQQREWWTGHKKVVQKALADKRSTTNGMMKLEVVSEFGIVECSVNRNCLSNILCTVLPEALFRKNQMPTLGEFRITNIIGDDEMFRLYCESLLSCVVGKTWWNNNSDKMKVSEMASVSDEAFALLLLENSYKMWKGMGEDLTYKIVRDRETTVDMSKRMVPAVGTIGDSNEGTAETSAQEPQQDDGRSKETAAATEEEVIQEKGRQKQRRRRGKNEQGESSNGYANTKWTFNGPDTKKYHGWDIKGMYRYKKLYRDITKMRKTSKNRREREEAYMGLREKIASKRKKTKVAAPRELDSYKQPNGFDDLKRMQAEKGLPGQEGELLDEEEFILSGDEYYEEEEEMGEGEGSGSANSD
jgi:hypothetical protein